jgi:hypothetical protein
VRQLLLNTNLADPEQLKGIEKVGAAYADVGETLGRVC